MVDRTPTRKPTFKVLPIAVRKVGMAITFWKVAVVKPSPP